MKIRLAADLQEDSIVDGIGIRTVIWTQGCSHNCPYCHNPKTHDFNGGELVELDDVIEAIENLTGQDGVTFSGGDPMFQPKACSILAKKVKELGMNVWAYTGFTYEQMLRNSKYRKLLEEIDVLVDGKFILEKKSYDLYFRGSTNQRIINVVKSLEEERVVLIEEYTENKNYENTLKKPEYLFI